MAEETNNSLIAELQSEVTQLREKLMEKSQSSETEQCLKDEIDRLQLIRIGISLILQKN